jgi:hypothetical protein
MSQDAYVERLGEAASARVARAQPGYPRKPSFTVSPDDHDMHLGKSYKFSEFLFWTRRQIYALAICGSLPVVLFKFFAKTWLSVPLTIPFVESGFADAVSPAGGGGGQTRMVIY